MRDAWAPGTVTEKVEFSPEPVDEQEPEPQVPPHIALRSADAALDVARHDLRVARATLANARETVGKSLAAYNAATPTITPEQNIRQHLAANQAERARKAARGMFQYRPTVSETAKAMAGGGYGNDMRARRGGGAAFRRGAYTKAQAATVNAQQIRAARADEAARMAGSNAPRVKLLSEK
jgi:multidrug resistance efflux pump